MGSNDVGKLYPAAKAVLTPLFRAAWRFDLRGLENVPASGPAILCPNHTSVLDSFFVPAMLPRRVTYVGKAEYMDDWKTRRLFPALGMIPIDRSGGDAAERALATAQRLLEQGELFGIYPEGTRSRDGRLYRGKTGPARLALRTGAPIIPIGMHPHRRVQVDVPILEPLGHGFQEVAIRTIIAARGEDSLLLHGVGLVEVVHTEFATPDQGHDGSIIADQRLPLRTARIEHPALHIPQPVRAAKQQPVPFGLVDGAMWQMPDHRLACCITRLKTSGQDANSR